MKQQISHISVHQSSKVMSLLYFLPLAIFTVPIGIIFLFMQQYSNALVCFLFPLVYLLFTYLLTALIFWIYNRVASYVGGFEFTLTSEEKEDNHL